MIFESVSFGESFLSISTVFSILFALGSFSLIANSLSLKANNIIMTVKKQLMPIIIHISLFLLLEDEFFFNGSLANTGSV